VRHPVAKAVGATVATALLTACGGSASDGKSGSAAPSVSPRVGTPAVMTSGHLKVCTALSTGNPPTYYFDANQKPTGAEVDLAKAVGEKLGLSVDFFDVAFASIIPALQGKQCDVIMSSLYIKPEREKVVDFVPYLMSGSAVIVGKGNPRHVTGMDDSLCGLKMTATVGKTAALLAEDQRKKCASDGKPALQVTQVDSTTAGVQQVMTGQADAYAGELPVVLYYQHKQPGTFRMAGKSFGAIKVGAAVRKGNTKLAAALQKAFGELKSDGEYTAILKKWNLSDLALNSRNS
jgi:polar amino acid transport system substrate-binding protein